MKLGNWKPLNLKELHWIQFSPDNTLLAGCTDRNLACWDLTTRKKSWSLPFKYPQEVAFSSGGLAAMKMDTGEIVVLDPSSGDILTRFTDHLRGEGGTWCFRHAATTWWRPFGTDT